MKLRMIGCSHRNAPISVRERLAFSSEQNRDALEAIRRRFPSSEAVLLSTCNRTELYLATENGAVPSLEEVADFLGTFRDLDPAEIVEHLQQRADAEAIRHLFQVASSLDSMVVGEAQILSQVKQAYQLATEQDGAGPLSHAVFQAALRVARRVAGETAIHQRRVSIPSVAVADFAQQIFERFDNKNTLVIGAGEMGEETLLYLKEQGARDVTVINRNPERATELAARWEGVAVEWDGLPDALAAADLVISTTSSTEPIVTLDGFREVETSRRERPLFILDLAVPRDFDPRIADRAEVYLYSIDDLRQACDRNRRERDKELPAAARIIEQETARFMRDLHHRVTGPVIRQLRQGMQESRDEELRRLFNKLPDLDDRARDEINQSFDRLVNKVLHPPLESLRHESRQGIPHSLLEALSKLFQLKD